MTFTESIKTGLHKLTDFSGRAGRSEYWWFSLFLLLVLALLVGGIVLASRASDAPVSFAALSVLGVPLALALVAAQVRRLRDAGLGPWWVLVNGVPYAGVPLVLALTLLPSTRGQDGGDTSRGAVSALSMMMITGWSGLTGAGALSGDKPAARPWWPLVGGVLGVTTVIALAWGVYQYKSSRAPQPAPAPTAAPAPATLPQSGPGLSLLDKASGASLYFDPSTARLVGPDMVSIQLVFDFGQPREREGVSFLSLKQNEVFHCAERTSFWTTRFYMSEAMGEGAAVFIEEGKGSLLDMSDAELGNQRLSAVCRLLPGLGVPQAAAGKAD